MKTYTDAEVLEAMKQSKERVLSARHWAMVLLPLLPDADKAEVIHAIQRMGASDMLLIVPRQYALKLGEPAEPTPLPKYLSRAKGSLREKYGRVVYQAMWRNRKKDLSDAQLHRFLSTYSDISPKMLKRCMEDISRNGWYKRVQLDSGQIVWFHGPAELHVELSEEVE